MKTPLRGVIFDFDNTLFYSPLDFHKIREEIGGVDGSPLLEFLQAAPPDVRERGMAILEERAVPRALLTRNSRDSVNIVFQRFPLQFNAVICRGEAPPKPSPEPVWKIAREWGVEPKELLLVGDHRFDMESGRRAGAWTAFVTNRKPLRHPVDCDFLWQDLLEGAAHLRQWIEGHDGGS